MPIMTVGTGRSLIYSGIYNELMLATQPAAYWPQNETNGTNAACLTNSAMDGTQSSDVGTRGPLDFTGPFGMSAPYYDGINDYCNVQTAALVAAFSGDAGTIMIWCKVNAVGIWADATIRYSFYTGVDGNNNLYPHTRTAVANIVRSRYEASTVAEIQDHTVGPSLAWFLGVMTWDINAGVDGEVRHYTDGVQVGVTDTTLGAWVGNPVITIVGAASAVPTSVWHGWLGPCGLWNRALPPAEIAGLYVT